MKWLLGLFGKGGNTVRGRAPQIFFFNTLSEKKELFLPQWPDIALMYSCGPTVYQEVHIGNLRSYIFSDTIARTLEAADYRVHRVINITDVGHLVGDADSGEDKITLAAEREKTTPQAIAERYTKKFIENLDDLNIDIKDIRFPRATDYISEQIAFAKTLEEKGFAYRTKRGLVFDTSRFPGYGKLGNYAASLQQAGARIEVDPEKKHPADFLLWRSAKPGDLQQWNSPWGYGNPGWHIECSAMSRALLGKELDIHTGGEDHIAIHHNNEIAQSEAASGRTFVHYWMHNAFLNSEGEKISKSIGNVTYLSDIVAKGFHPLALRYFFLQAHYRTPLSFSWDAIAGAASALNRLWTLARDVAQESKKESAPSEAHERFLIAMRDDLATPQALGVLWDSLRSDEYAPEEKWGLLETAEAHFGLTLLTPPVPCALSGEEMPVELKEMLAKREEARASKDFDAADRIRGEIENRGYRVDDGPNGPVLTRTTL
jgi:cysteinyl-tRNA synthetase